jgi:excisionase family DNA binding protein
MNEAAIVDLKLLDEAAAAQALGLKPRMLRDRRRRGEISFRRIGRLIRYARADLEEFVERSKVEP